MNPTGQWKGLLFACAVGLIAGAFLMHRYMSQPAPSDTAIDSLRTANTQLGTRATRLQEQVNAFADALAHQEAQRASAVIAAKVRTDTLVARRRILPEPSPSLPDSTLHTAYRVAVVQLDSALLELQRKDLELQADSMIFATADSLHRALQAESVTLKQQVATANAEAALWQEKYEATEHRCGLKCGIVIGATTVTVLAVAVNQVKHVFDHSSNRPTATVVLSVRGVLP